jgi:hypothetical protein
MNVAEHTSSPIEPADRAWMCAIRCARSDVRDQSLNAERMTSRGGAKPVHISKAIAP